MQDSSYSFGLLSVISCQHRPVELLSEIQPETEQLNGPPIKLSTGRSILTHLQPAGQQLFSLSFVAFSEVSCMVGSVLA